MLEFNTVEELKNCKELMTLGRYQNQKVKLAGKEVYACTTNQQYEDIIWGGIRETLEKLNKQFGNDLFKDEDEDDITYASSLIRDAALEKLKEEFGIEFVDVFDEY